MVRREFLKSSLRPVGLYSILLQAIVLFPNTLAVKET
jgi:hypothetical protein